MWEFLLVGIERVAALVHEKATKYIPSVKLKIFHYPEQKGPLYYIDMKER